MKDGYAICSSYRKLMRQFWSWRRWQKSPSRPQPCISLQSINPSYREASQILRPFEGLPINHSRNLTCPIEYFCKTRFRSLLAQLKDALLSLSIETWAEVVICNKRFGSRGEFLKNKWCAGAATGGIASAERAPPKAAFTAMLDWATDQEIIVANHLLNCSYRINKTNPLRTSNTFRRVDNMTILCEGMQNEEKILYRELPITSGYE